MSYPYTRTQIHDFVQAAKVVRANTCLAVEKRGEHGAAFDVNLDLVGGAFIDLRYLGKATEQSLPPTYESALLLGGHRVRGVGHNFVGRNNLRSKQRIPAGWHQNRCDPNLPTTHVEYICTNPPPRPSTWRGRRSKRFSASVRSTPRPTTTSRARWRNEST